VLRSTTGEHSTPNRGVGVKKARKASCILWLIGLLVLAASAAIPSDIVVSDPFTDNFDQTSDDTYRAPAPVVVVMHRKAERQPTDLAWFAKVFATQSSSRPAPTRVQTVIPASTASVIVLCCFRN
jgi:hypothetical protein